MALSEGDDDHDDEPALMLLADCRKIFDETAGSSRTTELEDEITSADLVKQLHALEDRPWTEWGRMKKPITANGVARLLKRYDIRPDNIGTDQNNRPKGYCWAAVRRRVAALRRRRMTQIRLYPSFPSAHPLKALFSKGLRPKPSAHRRSAMSGWETAQSLAAQGFERMSGWEWGKQASCVKAAIRTAARRSGQRQGGATAMTSRLDALGIKTHSLENRDNLDEFHASPWIAVGDIGNGRYTVTVVEVVEAEMQDKKTGQMTMKDTLVFEEPKIKCGLPLNETNFNVMRNSYGADPAQLGRQAGRALCRPDSAKPVEQ